MPSGGAATLILESYESALKRGVNILGEVVGYGFSSNGEHISNPNVDGPTRAMKMALKQAGLGPDSIDYVNAHATSTPVGDQNEARAIDLLFSWLQSANTNVTTKSRALLVLFRLTKKYPELRNELKICIEEQMDRYTVDFAKRAKKILNEL